MLEHARHDDMAALDQADRRPAVVAHPVGQDLRDPRAGRVDDHPGARLLPGAGASVQQRQPPMPVLACRRSELAANPDRRAPCGGIHGVQDHQTRVVDPTVGVLEAAREAFLQHLARFVAAQVDGAAAGQALAPAEMVIEEQAQADQPGRPQAGVVRQHEAQRPDDVRGHVPEHFAFQQGFPDQPEFVVLQISQPAMDQLGRRRRGSARQIALLEQENRKIAPGRIACDAAAIHAPADDRDVVHPAAPAAASVSLEFELFRKHAQFLSQIKLVEQI